MRTITWKVIILTMAIILNLSCNNQQTLEDNIQSPKHNKLTAKDILGNPDYLAISYGGYRQKSRNIQPTVEQLKEDMKILAAMNIKVLRTYNTKLAHASNVLKAIRELKEEDSSFEMYMMLGVWIDCENAWTDHPNHDYEDVKGNSAEIQRAVDLANQYPDIVKIIAVGNEAMVKWAAIYYVQPWVILKWVNHLQGLKKVGEIPKDLWITSSDNFASWGGGGSEYHTEDLSRLIRSVDYVSLHTYPMHDTHYNSQFWGIMESEDSLTDIEKIKAAMERAKEYAVLQYQNTTDYIRAIDSEKLVHIGETGWASSSNGHYGSLGSMATDEYKESIYYNLMRDWTNKEGISCFYFEAFDEPWKASDNPGNSENHFGLFDINGKAKYVVWDLVDQGAFKGLSRNGHAIVKTYDGDKKALLKDVLFPPLKEAVEIAY
ncbi:MAG: exo-beta-1,3-glucanase (GH17 family) [Maribacter sp.]|jgi:exo-beta-1,3-glucanase (GH17 family)